MADQGRGRKSRKTIERQGRKVTPTSEQLKQLAEEDRRKAEELAADTEADHGSYPDYLLKRAAWRDQLAREREAAGD